MHGGGDAGNEVLAVDRLRDVTVKACLERCLPISHGRVRGDGNHGIWARASGNPRIARISE